MIVIEELTAYYHNVFYSKRVTLQVPETKIAEFANSVELDYVAHNEPSHLHLHCLPSSL